MQYTDTRHAHIALMQQNMAGHFSCLQRATEEMAVQDRDGCMLVDSGLPSDTFNILFCPGQPADATLRDAVSYFRSRQLSFAAWVGPESQAGPLLEGLGLRPTEAETGMLLSPADFRPCDPPAGLRVERVTDTSHLAHFASVVAGQPSDALVVEFYQRARHAALDPASPMRLFVGYAKGEPVATAEAFLSEEVVGIYSVATLASHRRRGIGSAMTARAIREGFEAGKRLAVLQASADGRGIYERLGFRAACEFTVFE
jgi:ribosomal protein S18 acetylase RimI-like enzyme